MAWWFSRKGEQPKESRERPGMDRVKEVVDRQLEEFSRPRQSPWANYRERVAREGVEIAQARHDDWNRPREEEGRGPRRAL